MRDVLRAPVQVGLLAMPALNQLVNYGRSLGLDVDLHISGWLIRSGYVVASGEPEAVRRFAAALELVAG